VGSVTVGVLVAFVVEGRVLVSYQRGLLDEVAHGSLVTFGADVQARLVCRLGRIRPGPLFAVGLGVVYDPQQPQSVAPSLSLDATPPSARHRLPARKQSTAQRMYTNLLEFTFHALR
jgi:hypothetical protein